MKEINVIKLDNGLEYYEVDTITYNDVDYILLALVSNVKDICIRKYVYEDGNKLIGYLEDSEFDLMFKKFYEKNKVSN